jgi:hypothetical protein
MLEQAEVTLVELSEVLVVTEMVDVVEVEIEIVVVEVMLAVSGTVPSDGDASQLCTCNP